MGDNAEKSAQDKIGESVGMIRIDEVLKPCEILTVVGSILAVGINQSHQEEPCCRFMKARRAAESSRSTPGRTPSPEAVVSFTGLRGCLIVLRAKT